MQNAQETIRVKPAAWALSCARRIPAVHTRRLMGRDALLEFMRQQRFPPADATRKYADTREMERVFGVDPGSIYAFLGRGFWRGLKNRPTIAVLLPLSLVANQRGEVTPFDTGRLYWASKKPNDYKMKLPTAVAGTVDEQKTYLRQNSLPLDQCCQYLASHLSCYFKDIANYWKVPDEPIDGVRYAAGDEGYWGDWTLEARFYAGMDCSGCRIIMDRDRHRDYLSLVWSGQLDEVPVEVMEDKLHERAEALAREGVAS